MTFICPDSLNMCSLSSYKQRERRECGYSRRFYRLNVYTTNLYPPTGNLDSQNSREVIALLKHASQAYEQTIIMITHNRSIAQCADRVLQVSDGVVTDYGRVQDIRERAAARKQRQKEGAV